MSNQQNVRNHARLNPLYHFVAMFPLLANFVWAVYRIMKEIGGSGVTADAVAYFVLSFGCLAMLASIRNQVLIVQDRIIRLEMRFRLNALFPPEMRPRLASLTTPQLIALRFASDAEMPDLVAEVLSGKCPTPKEIKLRVKDWQGDYLRA